MAACGETSPEAEQAFEELFRIYWYHVYAFVRRSGHGRDDAADLTQEFFTRVLEKETFHSADPLKGRFRTFLLTAVQRFLVNQWRRSRRQKRGGGRRVLSLDFAGAEERYRLEPVDVLTAERLFERSWALRLLEEALVRLSEESAASGRGALFEEVKSAVAGDEGRIDSYAAIARRLGMTEGAVKTWVFRLRRRFGELLRAEISRTLADPADVDDEIRCLMETLAR